MSGRTLVFLVGGVILVAAGLIMALGWAGVLITIGLSLIIAAQSRSNLERI